MLNKQFFDDISVKISDAIANSPIKDVEQNIKAILGSAFNRLDLVTREEFDIQQQVLLKTREKLAELEAKVNEIATLVQPEQQAKDPSPEQHLAENISPADVSSSAETTAENDQTSV